LEEGSQTLAHYKVEPGMELQLLERFLAFHLQLQKIAKKQFFLDYPVGASSSCTWTMMKAMTISGTLTFVG
jgi:hypothetical protein